MPTIDELPAATASADTDELIVSQSGITRKLTRAQLLAGLQSEFTAGAGQLLGNSSGGGGTEGISVGNNLILANGTLSATSTPFVISALPTGTAPASTDLVAFSQGGTNVAVTYNQFVSGLSSLSSINASHFNITPTGSTSVLQLGQFAANTIQKSGAQMSGPLLLASDPTLPLQAATMEYVQNQVTAAAAGAITNSGGTISGLLSAHGGLDVSVTRNWSGGTNYNDANPTQAGLSGVQSFSGTVAAQSQASSGTMLNELLVQDSLNAGLAGGAVGFNIQHNVAGATAQGARTALQSTLQVQGPTGNTGGSYSGIEASCIASGNDNGTAANPSGGIVGINTVSQLGSTCTHWGSCVGHELDLGVAAGANVQTLFGLHVGTPGNHAVNGSLDDIAIHISGSTGQSAFWNTGIGFGANTKPTAFGPNSTLIKAYPAIGASTLAVQCGLDWTALQTTGNMMQTPGYQLSGYGQITQTLTNPGPSSAAIVPHEITFSPTADRGVNGYTGFSAQVIAGTISQNPDNSGSRFNTEYVSVQLTTQTTSGTGSIGHSAIGTHVSKLLPVQANGTVYNMGSNDTLPACWSLYGTAVDQSNLPTSKSGPLACQEFDMQVNAIDDQGVRGGYAFNADTKLSLSSNGIPATVAQGFYTFGLNDTWIWTGHRTGGNHIMSAHDCRAVTGPETSVRVASTGTTVAVANVTPYTIGSNDSGTGVTLGGPGSNPINNVKIGSNTYQVTAATLDGPGQRSGVLTLSSALQGTDGAAGNGVARPFYALIMRTGDRIAFDYDGNVQMFYDSSVFNGGGGIHVKSSLDVDGSIATGAGNGLTVGSGGITSSGAISALGGLTSSTGVNVTGGFLQPSSFTVAGLPNASSTPANAIIWVSNALKPGEASGSGSGVLACRNAAGTAWLRIGDYTALAA
jgi:hypothetical protein